MDRTMVRAGVLARLRDHIADIERGARAAPLPPLADEPARARALALWPGVAAQGGVLHEMRSPDYRDAPAALGFALGLAARLCESGGALVFIERAHEAARSGALSARGLSAFGLDPARAFFIRARTEENALFAAEEAARTKGVAAALFIVSGAAPRLTLTASRRLHLAAGYSGATPIIVRSQHSSSEAAPTGASMRWRVEARASGPAPFDAKAPGSPRWFVTLEKAASFCRLSPDQSFLVEWRHDEKRFVLPDRGAAAAPESTQGFQPAPDFGARLPAFVRRSSSSAHEGAGRAARAL